MRFIPTKIHGVIDYAAGLLFIASPWLFGFANGGAAQWVPIVVGLTALGTSLLTDYELGVYKVVAMPLHLMLDVAEGLVLVASPWVFGFAEYVYWPHVIFGIMAITASLTTRKIAYDSNSPVQMTQP